MTATSAPPTGAPSDPRTVPSMTHAPLARSVGAAAAGTPVAGAARVLPHATAASAQAAPSARDQGRSGMGLAILALGRLRVHVDFMKYKGQTTIWLLENQPCTSLSRRWWARGKLPPDRGGDE